MSSTGPEEANHGAGVTGMTVGNLIRQWLHPVDDPWHLALVQRDRVWNALRVSRLLDSLLGGYPIGTLLLCRLPQETIALGESRAPTHVKPGTWQLLDGQQRISALVALFTDQPGFERFYLDMFGRRWWDESIATSTVKQAAATSYIRYRATDEEQETWNPIEGRSGFLRLAGVSGWIGGNDTKVAAALERLDAAATETEPSRQQREALRFLEEIDPAFVKLDDVVDSQLPDLLSRTRKLLGLWFHEIPVHRTELETEHDILQVFERVNLEGVRVAGDDVFFAAIKTRWPNAEPCLRRATEAVPVLDRISALRVFSRLAALADAQADLLPLRVDRLNPPRGAPIRERLELLTHESAPALLRMTRVADVLVHSSRLGYGLRLVPRALVDHVLAWAAVSARLDLEPPTPADTAEIAGFLVGATVYRYPSTFDDAWSRMTMQLVLRAGIAGRPFPVAEIIRATRQKWPELRSGRSRVSPHDPIQLANNNATLVLSIAQGLPFNLPRRTRHGQELPSGVLREIEWDHIWPSNQQRRMKVRRQLVPGADRVGHAGNFWALDRPLNNRLRDHLPKWKFDFLSEPTRDEHMPDRWPAPENGFLDPDEIAELMAVDEDLPDGRTDLQVLAAAARYGNLIDRRTTRLFDTVASLYPMMSGFAPPSAPIVEDLFDEPPGVDPFELSAALGLPAPTHTIRQIRSGEFDDGVAAVVAIADQLDLGDDLRQMIHAAREAGFRAAGVHPPRDPVWRWLKFGLENAGKQKPALFWIVPEPGRRALRVNFVAGNLEWLLNLAPERSRQIFGSQGDRDYIEGQADIFIAETLTPLGSRLREAFPDA